jgi:protein-disulfide isomerase
VERELVERYVENGTLRIEWRDFAYLRQESVKTAQAARAAQEQGRFWEYHDALYENQGSINGEDLLGREARRPGAGARTRRREL